MNEDAYLAAGDAYDQANQPSEAIKYWNVYLEMEPEGEQARGGQRAHLDASSKGGMTTEGSGGGEHATIGTR